MVVIVCLVWNLSAIPKPSIVLGLVLLVVLYTWVFTMFPKHVKFSTLLLTRREHRNHDTGIVIL